jgi:hypothetical protein
MSMSRAKRFRLTPDGFMNSSNRISPGVIGDSFLGIADRLLVIVDNFNVPGIPINPAETNPPLAVDADAVLAHSIAPKHLKCVARRRPQLVERFDGVQHQQFSPCWSGYSGESPDQEIMKQSQYHDRGNS